MIGDNQKTFNQLHVIFDGLLVAAAYILAWYCKFKWFNDDPVGVAVLDRGTYFSFLFYIIPGFLIIYYFSGMYYSKRYSTALKEMYNIFRSNIVGIAFLFSLIYLFKIINISREMIRHFLGFVNLFLM